jgi:tetratricopeptide (TPR) repeat protein
MDPRRLFTIAPTTGDALRDRDAVLRLYCSGPNCAVAPQVHLGDARRNASTDPDAAVVQAMLARWTTDPEIRNLADALLKSLLARDAPHEELFQLMERCTQTPPQNPASLSALILTRCGFYWSVESSTGHALSSFEEAEASFKKGEDASATLQLLLRSLDQDPGQGKAWSYLGGLLLFLQRPAEAVAALHQAVLVNPASLDARMNLADAYRSLGAEALATAMYRDILARVDAGATAEFTPDIRAAAKAKLASAAPQP